VQRRIKNIFEIMNLILWRHADAEDAAAGHLDHARELTAKGREQAKRMATWLNDRLPANTVVLVSPALRAQQTAKALNKKFTTRDALGTDTDCTALLEAVGTPTADGTTLVVGHQPTLGQVASLLLTGAEGALSVKKGAVWWISVRHDRKSLGVLRAVMTPELL
jgi:phosphohistidine phosphatase